MAKLPHVALLIESSRQFGRGLLHGVAHFVREKGPWSVYFRPMALDQAPPPWLKHWRGDGILARIDSRKTADAVLETGLPVVDLRRALPELDLPHVGVANEAIVKLALEHLTDRGFRRFGFCGTTWEPIQELRCDCFRRLAQQDGCPCGVFLARPGRRRVAAWEEQQERITGWLGSLPKPVGIMAGNDECGLQVLDGCQRAGLLVPDEVAVVSVDSDECLCRLANPPMSSVDVNPMQIGYQAAALLDRMMAGEPPPVGPIEVEPRGVVTRQSTDVLAVEDRQVARALRFIREHAWQGIRVQQVVRHLDLSPSTLERRFKKLLGRTPKAEIVRVQFEKAKELLARTDLPIATVGQRSGFSSPKYFSEMFSRRMGMPPQDYRQQFQRLD